jgi:hypothetical protein
MQIYHCDHLASSSIVETAMLNPDFTYSLEQLCRDINGVFHYYQA